MWKVIDRFTEWVDSFGDEAGERMIVGMVAGAAVGGAVCLGVAIVLESPALLALGFVVCVGHILFAMAAL